jgi:hypothetical protein
MPATPITHSPAEIMAQLLVDLGMATGPGGSGSWPVFKTGITDKPDDCIAVTDTAGIDDGAFLGPGATTEQHYGVQIMVRAATHPRCWVKTEAIRQALRAMDNMKTVWIGAASYTLPAVCRLAPPTVIGKDRPDSTRVLMSLNPTFAIYGPGELG